jgi:tetratricopeptide (TPR) repeat protein
LRLGGKAIFAGAISTLGSHYVVGLEALACSDGATLAVDEAEATSKENVIKALGEVGSHIRAKVGESLPSLQKYDLPVNATTKSLEALKAFSMGLQAERDTGVLDSIPFYRHAIELDPDFALAYAVLGRAYADFGEDAKASQYYTRAFQLRDRLSEREKLFITTLYNETLTGDLEAAKEAGELWAQTYPLDAYAHEKLATVYNDLGLIEKAYEQSREALRLVPSSDSNVYNAVMGALDVDRHDEAEEMIKSAEVRGLEGEGIHEARYWLAFLRGDTAETERQIGWATGKPGIEELFVEQQSETKAAFGQLRAAAELSARAARLATRDHELEIAANCKIISALRQIESGSPHKADPLINSAISLAPTRNIKLLAAMAFARSGKAARARALLKEVARQNPANTLVKSYWVPTIEAISANGRNPQLAISILQATTPYELSQAAWYASEWFYPIYIRGESYLLLQNGRAAAKEYRKMVDHPGMVQNGLLGSLARLQLARSEATMGNRDAALKWYEDFLTLWKDADLDIPVLQHAQGEYAKLSK